MESKTSAAIHEAVEADADVVRLTMTPLWFNLPYPGNMDGIGGLYAMACWLSYSLPWRPGKTSALCLKIIAAGILVGRPAHVMWTALSRFDTPRPLVLRKQ